MTRFSCPLTACQRPPRFTNTSVKTVREVFDISGFSTILAVSRTEAEALTGF